MKNFKALQAFTLLNFFCLGFALNLYQDDDLIEEHIQKKFQRFKEKYSKQYSSEAEERFRYEVFKENYLTMLELRDENNGSKVLGITEFMDVPQRQFLHNYFRNPIFNRNQTEGGNKWNEKAPQVINNRAFHEEGEIYQEQNDTTTNASNHLRNLNTIPSSFDWRDYGIVSSVKNQGSCGGCWSFAAITSVESAYARKHKTLYSLSSQQLIDCNNYGYGCGGGTIAAGLTYLKSNYAMTLASYPYLTKKQYCKYNKNYGVTKVTSFYYSGTTDEGYIASMLYHGGVLAVNINATPLQYYKGGIFNPVSCSNTVNHGVNIVGYGSSNGVPYWIVKNSWGSNWGESGYFRIYRGRKLCGMTSTVIAAKVE